MSLKETMCCLLTEVEKEAIKSRFGLNRRKNLLVDKLDLGK
jgi:hypothetical protein